MRSRQRFDADRSEPRGSERDTESWQCAERDDANGARRWLQRIVNRGKRRDLGLGSLDLVPLAEARVKAVANRKVSRAGGDAIAEKREKAAIPTFAEALTLYLAGL